MSQIHHIKDNSIRRRTLTGVLVRPREQIKVAAFVAAMSAVFLSFVVGAFALQLKVSADELSMIDPEASQKLWAATGAAAQMLALDSVVLVGFAFVFGMIFSHRIYGPLVPILRQIESLRAGHGAARIHLRRGDELAEVAAALNQLADSIRSQRETAEGSRMIRTERLAAGE